LQLLIPSAISGAIIGRNGQFVKHLQDRSGAEIQFHRNERADHTRLVIITGSLDQCIRAQKMIITKISEEREQLGLDPTSTTPIPTKMLIPNSVVGRFVGKWGKSKEAFK